VAAGEEESEVVAEEERRWGLLCQEIAYGTTDERASNHAHRTSYRVGGSIIVVLGGGDTATQRAACERTRAGADQQPLLFRR